MTAVDLVADPAHPALAGYRPMTTGRRAVVALVDGVLALAVGGLVAVAVAFVPRDAALWVALGMSLVWFAAVLWIVLARASRPAGLFLGARYVDATTGKPAGARLLGKFVLQGALAAASAGIAPLVICFATVDSPLRRNWFDRSAGVMLVDARGGRRPGDPPPAAPAVAPPPAVASVVFPAGAVGAVGPAGWASDLGRPSAPPAAVKPVVGDGAIITSTPHSAALPTQPAPSASVSPIAPPVVRDIRIEPPASDRTVLAGDYPSSPVARLDDGTALRLDPPTVIGRNPSAPGSHPDAAPVAVDDALASKSHLLLGVDDAGPWVIDLHSTNGVTVTRGDATDAARIAAGRKVHLSEGSTVAFGSHTIRIGR